ncbi:MAG TPA: TonB-dependent receptor [Burkholderiaceae bacterium]|nr:TonB-dependent receptor [Burkholderiaceae bacterium]
MFSMVVSPRWSALGFSLCVTALAAAEPARELEAVVVSAARFAQAPGHVLAPTTVFTRADIEAAQVSDVASLVARAAGVEVVPLGGVGAQTGLFVRGGESRHVLVLVDGVALGNLNFSLAALDQLMVGQVERIEVVRGNVSSLYGSQAASGVIQIFTRGASVQEGVRSQVRVASGSQQTHEAAASVDGAAGLWRYALAASHFETQGRSAIDVGKRVGANPDEDGYNNHSGSAMLGVELAPGHALELRAWGSRGQLDYDSEFGPATQTDRSEQHVEAGSLTLRDQLTSDWRSTLRVSRLRDALDAQMTAFPFFVTSRSTQLSWQHELALGSDWTLLAAAERAQQAIASNTVYGRNDRDVDAALMGLTGRSGAHQWQFNVRHDRYSDFGDADTGRIAYGYAIDARLRAQASVSTAFNAPTFNDLFYPFGGNMALRPEKARSGELGLQWLQPGLRVDVTAFLTRYRDLIGNDASFNRANIGRARMQGLEGSVDTRLADTRLRLSATVQDARDEASDVRLVRRARAFADVQLERRFGALDAQLHWRVSSDRLDRAGGQTHRLGGFGLLDVALRWRVDQHWSATARVSNVLNKAYEQAWGYPGAARAVLIGLEARM